LLPIVGGVILTTSTQLELTASGLTAAILTAMLSSVQSIVSKKMMRGVDHLNLLLGTTKVCVALFLPVWLLNDGSKLLRGEVELAPDTSVAWVLAQLIGASACGCVQTIIAFSFLSLVPPVTYSIASVSKRIFIISISMAWEGSYNGVSNLLGIGMAMGGIGLYSLAKLNHVQAAENATAGGGAVLSQVQTNGSLESSPRLESAQSGRHFAPFAPTLTLPPPSMVV
jgi:solute carrier family 35 protein E1